MSSLPPFFVPTIRRVSASEKRIIETAFPDAEFEFESGLTLVKCYEFSLASVPTYSDIEQGSEFLSGDILNKITNYRRKFANDPTRFPFGRLITSDKYKNLIYVKNKVAINNFLAVKRVRHGGCGRFISNPTIATLPRCIKGTLFSHLNYIDLDQRKSCCSLLVVLGTLYRFPTPHLRRWIEHTMEVYEEVKEQCCQDLTLDDVKMLFTRLAYGGSYEQWKRLIENGTLEDDDYVTIPKTFPPSVATPPAINNIAFEIQTLMTLSKTINSRFYSCFTEKNDRAIFSMLIQTMENHVNYEALRFLMSNECNAQYGFKIRNYVWSYDGLSFIKETDTDFNAVCASINEHIVNTCGPEFSSVCYVVKDYSDWVIDLQVNTGDPMDPDEDLLLSATLNYDDWKDWFHSEYKVFFISNKGLYGMSRFDVSDGRWIGTDILGADELTKRFRDLQYSVTVNKKGVTTVERKQALQRWLNDIDKKRVKDIGRYPYPRVCPHGVFNTWVDCKYHYTEPLFYDDDAIREFLDLTYVICGKDDAMFNWMQWFLKHAVQRPGEKAPNFPVLCGSEGMGKSTFTSWVCRIFGEERCKEGQMKDVCGPFNSILDKAYIFVMNEFPTTLDNAELNQLKTITTEIDVIINPKGVDQYQTQIYTRFFATGNNYVTIASTRRPVFMKIAMDYFENGAKWTTVRKFMDDPNACHSIYKFLQNSDMRQHGVGDNDNWLLKPPENEFNTRRKKNIYLDFLQYLCTQTFPDADECQLTNSLLKGHFQAFMATEGYSNDVISNYNPKKIIDGITSQTWPSNDSVVANLPITGSGPDNLSNKVFNLKVIKEGLIRYHRLSGVVRPIDEISTTN